MITTVVDDRVRTVTIDRPATRNALTRDMLETLETAVAEATEPVVCLRGAGPAFCAGADLETVADLTEDTAAAFARLGQGVARTIEETEAVTIAAIDGPARGGGLELALACDLRVASPGATLGEPAVAFGLFGAWGGTVRLPRIVGEGTALDLTVTGRSVDAETALQMGLISQIREDPETLADEVAAHPADTTAAVAARVRDDGADRDQEAAEAAAFATLVGSHREDVQSLLE